MGEESLDHSDDALLKSAGNEGGGKEAASRYAAEAEKKQPEGLWRDLKAESSEPADDRAFAPKKHRQRKTLGADIQPIFCLAAAGDLGIWEPGQIFQKASEATPS